MADDQRDFLSVLMPALRDYALKSGVAVGKVYEFSLVLRLDANSTDVHSVILKERAPAVHPVLTATQSA